jgi:hypothetical protein
VEAGKVLSKKAPAVFLLTRTLPILIYRHADLLRVLEKNVSMAASGIRLLIQQVLYSICFIIFIVVLVYI